MSGESPRKKIGRGFERNLDAGPLRPRGRSHRPGSQIALVHHVGAKSAKEYLTPLSYLAMSAGIFVFAPGSHRREVRRCLFGCKPAAIWRV